MPTYRNKTNGNVDTFSTNTDGRLSAKVGYIKPNEQIAGQDYGSVLKILSGEDAGRWVYESQFAIVPTPAPDPAPPPAPDPTPPPSPSPAARRLSVIVDGVKVFEMDIV